METKEKNQTLGEPVTPCPYCGCPDEFDHTQECPVLPEVVALQRRVKDLEHNQQVLKDALDGTLTAIKKFCAKIMEEFSEG
jgi:hypothetical protein